MSKHKYLVLSLSLVVFLFLPPIFAQVVPPSGIIGWWAGDGDGRDLSGNGLNGTLFNNGGYAFGNVGQGFDFVSGTLTMPSHLAVPDNALLNPAQFTIEAWVKFTPEFSNFHIAIAKGFSSGFNDSYALGTSGLANPQFFTTHNGSSHQLSAPANLANPDSWNHLAASYDGATKRIYVNGVLVNSVFIGLPIDYDPVPAPLTIGSDWEFSAPRYHFNGTVDEAMLYNRALSDAEILAIYNAGVNGKIKSAPTAIGGNSQTQVNDATITFQNVTAAGTTTDYTINPASAGALPGGFAQTGLAYEISTTAVFNGTVNLCFHIPAVNNMADFSKLRVFHSEGGTLINRTTSSDFAARMVCGQVTSLSPFVIANALAPTAASVSIGGRILAGGQGVSRAVVSIYGTGGEPLTAISNQFGYYRFDEIPAGETYVLTVLHKHYQFAPQIVTVSGDMKDLNFTAEP